MQSNRQFTTRDNTGEKDNVVKGLSQEESSEHMVYDAILNYLKVGMFTNTNNNADSVTKADSNKTEKIQPTCQVNNPTIIHSISRDNMLKRLISFKTFKNVHQSEKRSHMNCHIDDNSYETSGTFPRNNEQDSPIKYKSSEIITNFNMKHS